MPVTKKYTIELDELEGDMLRSALELVEEYCLAEVKKWPQSPLAEWLAAAKAVRSRMKARQYVAKCPFCQKPIQKPPTVCENCDTGISIAQELRFTESNAENLNDGAAKLNLYHEWRRILKKTD